MQKHIFKKVNAVMGGIFAVTLLAFLCGCASTKQTEDLLSAAGFKAQPANTAQRQTQLKALPAHTVSSVQKDGKQYFVYPDKARNVLYVGSPTQYEQYKKLREQQKWAEERVNPAEQMQVDFSTEGL